MGRERLTARLSGFLARLRHYRDDSDIGNELRAHFDSLTEEGLGAGLSLQEAKRRARLQLGDSQAVVERVREGEISTMLESLYRDFTLGLRSVRRNPVFAITAILTLAVGIGANTIVFTLLYGLLLRSLPVQDPASLVRIGVASTTVEPSRASSVPYQMLLQLRRQQKSFTEISAWQNTPVAMDMDDGTARMLGAGFVSDNGFEVLGMNAYLGRLLTPADDVRGGPAEGWPLVLSYGFWKDSFGGDPSIVGKQIKLSNTIVTVVGVAPQNFRGVWPGSETKVYLPFQFLTVIAGKDEINAPNSLAWCSTIGRLKPAVSVQEARAELAIYQKALIDRFIPLNLQERFRATNAYLWVSSARSGLPTFFGRVYSTPLYLMQGLVGIVLLLCCVNVPD
jgi:macrolide transport system ATP-binding/permease protein